jgi:hypothetical protein
MLLFLNASLTGQLRIILVRRCISCFDLIVLSLSRNNCDLCFVSCSCMYGELHNPINLGIGVPKTPNFCFLPYKNGLLRRVSTS